MMTLKNRKILITGGAGFIGSHLVEALVKNNRVTVYDNFSSSVVSLGYLGHLRNLNVIKGDILDEKKLGKALQGVDIVFHLAVSCIRLSLSNPTRVHAVNATGTLTSLLAAKKARVKRFVYISSSEIYGSAKKKYIDESHPIDPTTVYGSSKYMGELYTQYFHRHVGLPAVIIRPFNTYGPRSHFDGVYGEVIPRFVIKALSAKPPIIFGDGTQTRDFTYISDTIRGIMMAGQSDKILGDVVNIAYGKEVSVRALAKTISTLTALPFHPVYHLKRPNDIQKHAADISKAKKLLGFKPIVPLKEGLRAYIDWIKQTYPVPTALLNDIPTTNW